MKRMKRGERKGYARFGRRTGCPADGSLSVRLFFRVKNKPWKTTSRSPFCESTGMQREMMDPASSFLCVCVFSQRAIVGEKREGSNPLSSHANSFFNTNDT